MKGQQNAGFKKEVPENTNIVVGNRVFWDTS